MDSTSGPLLVLVGPPGAYIEEAARELSSLRSRPYASVNEAVAVASGHPASSIVIEGTAAELRGLEREVAQVFLSDLEATEPKILALGSASLGESVNDAEGARVRERLAELRAEGAHVVYLSADLASIVKRTGLDGPRFASVVPPRTILFTQLAARDALYRAVADTVLDTTGRDLGEVVDLLDELLGTA